MQDRGYPRYQPNACLFNSTLGPFRPAAYPLPSACNSINPSASPIFSFLDDFLSLSFCAFLNRVSQTKQTPDSRNNAVQVAHVTCPQTGATKTVSRLAATERVYSKTSCYCSMLFYRRDIFVVDDRLLSCLVGPRRRLPGRVISVREDGCGRGPRLDRLGTISSPYPLIQIDQQKVSVTAPKNSRTPSLPQ